MIINIRGTSGSGKTYAVRQAFNSVGPTLTPVTVMLDGGKPVANVVSYRMQPVYLLGDYTRTVCGGCDKISTQNMISSLVRYYSQFGHVIFEGMLTSGLYARYAALAKEMESLGEKYVWAFLDTPLEVCLGRIEHRRMARGDTRPLNPDNTASRYKVVLTCRSKAIDAGFTVRPIEYNGDVGNQILNILDEDYWSFELREEKFR